MSHEKSSHDPSPGGTCQPNRRFRGREGLHPQRRNPAIAGTWTCLRSQDFDRRRNRKGFSRCFCEGNAGRKMTEDLAWLEGPPAVADALVIPVHGLTKRELSAATGYTIKQIDKLCREGLPCRTTGSNRGGLRFDLPVVIEWIAAQREAEAAGDTDGTLAEAKRRFALAQARRVELENAKAEGRLLDTEVVGRYWVHRTSIFRSLALSTRIRAFYVER